jgi:hypothetical protein
VRAREIESEDVTSEMAKVAFEPRRGEAEAKQKKRGVVVEVGIELM